MIVRPAARAFGAVVVVWFALVHGSQAQQQPQPRPQPPRPQAQQPQAQPPQAQPPQAPQAREQPPQPSAAAVALAAQLLELKGGIGAFDPAIDGVITHHRNNLLQINPNLTRDIEAVAALIRTESAARRKEMQAEVAAGYASMFTEQDLKDMIAFYKTPLGRKMIEMEPKAGDASTRRAEMWIESYAQATMAKMRAEMKKRGHNEF
jgi:hypothetical protein